MLFIVVASVQNGLQIGIHDRIMSVIPHAFIPAGMPEEEIDQVRSSPAVLQVQDFFRAMGMVVTQSSSYGLQLFAIDESSVESLKQSVVAGDIENLASNGIALNERLAEDLGLELGDFVTITMSRLRTNGIQPLNENFKLVATFQFGVDLDYALAFVSLSTIRERRLLNAGEFGHRVWLRDYLAADEVFRDMPEAETWGHEFGDLFLGIQLEKMMLSVFMALVILLAGFNLVSAQTMVINVKRRDIAILTTMGASDAFVFRIFALQGSLIAAIGIGLGIALGILIAANAGAIMVFIDHYTGISLMQDSLWESVPANIQIMDVIVCTTVAVLISGFTVIYPVKKVLRMSPVIALNQQS